MDNSNQNPNNCGFDAALTSNVLDFLTNTAVQGGGNNFTINVNNNNIETVNNNHHVLAPEPTPAPMPPPDYVTKKDLFQGLDTFGKDVTTALSTALEENAREVVEGVAKSVKLDCHNRSAVSWQSVSPTQLWSANHMMGG